MLNQHIEVVEMDYSDMSVLTGDVAPADCAHHWIIATAEGPISLGTCKLCGECREFSNSPEAHFSDQYLTKDTR